MVSYHEAGHALVSSLIDDSSNVIEVSIVSRGKIGGYTMYEGNDDDINYISKEYCIKKISTLLAGRAAEKLVLNDISTGAANDLEKATSIATLMVTKYGMSECIGPIYLSDNEVISVANDFNNPVNMEIKKIIDKCYEICEKILEENRELLNTVAMRLSEEETISGDELRNIIKITNNLWNKSRVKIIIMISSCFSALIFGILSGSKLLCKIIVILLTYNILYATMKLDF